MANFIRRHPYSFGLAGAGLVLAGLLVGVNQYSSFHETKRKARLDEVIKIVEQRGENFNSDANGKLFVLDGCFANEEVEVVTLRCASPQNGAYKIFSADYFDKDKGQRIVDFQADAQNTNRNGYDASSKYSESQDSWYKVFHVAERVTGYIPFGEGLSRVFGSIADWRMRRTFESELDKVVDSTLSAIQQ